AAYTVSENPNAAPPVERVPERQSPAAKATDSPRATADHGSAVERHSEHGRAEHGRAEHPTERRAAGRAAARRAHPFARNPAQHRGGARAGFPADQEAPRRADGEGPDHL